MKEERKIFTILIEKCFSLFPHLSPIQVVQSLDNISLNKYVPPSPIIQQPVTPQYFSNQQPSYTSSSSQLPQSSVHHAPQQQQQQQNQTPVQRSQSSHQLEIAQAAAAAASRRQQVSRGLYKENSFEVRKPTSAGLSVDSFRLLSVLGRGHFGKVILSQYKNTGRVLWKTLSYRLCSN